MSKKFYVVWKGSKTGVFSTWAEVQAQTQGRSDAQFMGFPSKEAAEQAFASSYTKALMKRSLGKQSSTASSSKKATKTVTSSAHNISADVQIYCDGACSPNPGKSGTGVAVYQKVENKLQLTDLYFGLHQANGTNNTAELNGLLEACKLAQHFINAASNNELIIEILSDSKYSIDCITKWAKGWQAKGWTRGKGEEIKNLTIIQQCFALYQTIKNKITIRHVKGHANIEGNELSDRMAVLGRTAKQQAFIRFDGELDIRKILAMESG
ncbi:MAG: ribonuclease H family protein [Colwellia sp.]